jgi:NADH-quinone oxidoreductase subunit F
MDLRLLDDPPTDEERAAIDGAIGPADGLDESRITHGLREVESKRHLLLPTLHAAQGRMGFISRGALAYIAERLHVPPAEAFGVASFYALFSLTPRAPAVAHVCDDIACRAKGAESLCASLGARLGPEAGATFVAARRDALSSGATSSHATPPHAAATTWMRSPCLGLCEEAPAALVVRAGRQPDEQSFGNATVETITRALDGDRTRAHSRLAPPQADRSGFKLLARVATVDPTSLDAYRAAGGYRALRRAFEIGAPGVLREINDAKLVGRGGAAFPTGRKWEAVARAVARPHYVVCNADESEPGTFKDRVLMEDDPFAVIESMTLAGFATGSESGFVYIRGEYPLATERLANAIAQARAHGLLGDDILGRGVRFDIEIRRGAGAYICGEETSLLNSLEGYRGEPRAKPPFPVDVGLFGKPTCVNNVETLVSALEIVRGGVAAWTAVGTAGSTGTKLFCVSGHVARPGIYEVPYGTPLRALLAMAGAGSLRTVLLGGAAGTFVAPDEFDVPLTFEDTRRIHATLGSGVVMAFDESVDMLDILGRIAAFFRDESCGQCVPCRVGTVRMEELIARTRRSAPLASVEHERALLRELGQVMRDASICGLGQTASAAIESAVVKLRLFREAP